MKYIDDRPMMTHARPLNQADERVHGVPSSGNNSSLIWRGELFLAARGTVPDGSSRLDSCARGDRERAWGDHSKSNTVPVVCGRMVDHERLSPAERTQCLSGAPQAICGEAALQLHRVGHFRALRDAAKDGNLEVTQMLLKSGADVDLGVHGENGETGGSPVGRELTPLHEAAAGGHAAVVRALLAAGAPPDRLVSCAQLQPRACSPLYSIAPGAPMPHSQGLAPLHLAARYGHLEAARVLTEAGADVSARGSFLHDTALHLAATHGHLDVMRLLLEKGANVNFADRCGGTPLHLAKSLAAREFLLNSGADSNAVMDAPWGRGTPLRMVVASVNEVSEDFELDDALAHVRLLLEHGTSAKCDAMGAFRSPVPTTLHLSLAVFCGATKIVSAMLEAGFDPNQADVTPRGRRSYAVHHAAREGRVEILGLLLRGGARLDVRDETAFDSTPLHLACRFAQVGAVRELLLWGADVAALDLADATGEGRTPAGVLSLRKTYRPNENSLADPSQDEDEDLLPEDAAPARTVGNRSSRIIGARLMICGHLIGNRDDARDRNLIRCALRNEMRWRNRRALVLLKRRVGEQPDLLRDDGVNEAQCVVDSAEGGDSGDSGDSALSHALRRLLTIANLEGALFRRVVRFL